MAEETTEKVPNPRGRRLPPRPAAGTTMWYVLGVLLLLAVGNALFLTLQTGEQIPYSEFKARVRESKVQEVTVAEDRIHGKLKARSERAGASLPSASRIRNSSRTSSSTASNTRAKCRTGGLASCSAG